MPKQFKSALMVIGSLAAIALAAQRAPDGGDPLARAPASANSGANLTFRHTEKMRGPIDVRIDLVGPAPKHAGDVFTLSGVVASPRALDAADFRWSLPDAVELVAGEPEGALPAGDGSRRVQLTLRARDESNARVHLLVRARVDGARYAGGAQYNTYAQDEFTTSRRQLMKATAADAAEAPTDLRVFH